MAAGWYWLLSGLSAGLLARILTQGLGVVSAWASLGFLTAWWLGSKNECTKREPVGSAWHFYDLALEVT